MPFSSGPAIDALSPGRSSTGLQVVLVVGLLLTYGLPFFGFWLSFLIPLLVHVKREALWGAAGPRWPWLAVLLWVGLWWPAVSYYLTGGWYWHVTGRDLSTSWLLLPLCGPDSVPGFIVPALVAPAVFGAALAASVRLRRPWLLLVGAWAAPWAHELTFVAVGSRIGC